MGEYFKPVFPRDWYEDAACRGMSLDRFFGFGDTLGLGQGVRSEDRTRLREAKAICRSCPVQPQCLEHALTQPERFGIWGGKTRKERHDIRRRRALR